MNCDIVNVYWSGVKYEYVHSTGLKINVEYGCWSVLNKILSCILIKL